MQPSGPHAGCEIPKPSTELVFTGAAAPTAVTARISVAKRRRRDFFMVPNLSIPSELLAGAHYCGNSVVVTLVRRKIQEHTCTCPEVFFILGKILCKSDTKLLLIRLAAGGKFAYHSPADPVGINSNIAKYRVKSAIPRDVALIGRPPYL